MIIEILLFFPISFVAGVVCVGIKRDPIPEILRHAIRFCIYLFAGCALFSVFSYLLCRHLLA